MSLMTLHPDAEPVANDLWTPDAPRDYGKDGTVQLTIRGKKTSTPLDADREGADRIAAALITEPVFLRSFYTLFNHEPILIYQGTGTTELAERRG